MNAQEMEAIVGGYHGDAFRILGPHAGRKRRGQPCWEVRAFLPQAESADVLIGDAAHPMEKKHAAGFFVATLNGDPAPYRLRAHLWDGGDVEFDDPYRFPPVLSDFDL